jgi:hypothetical protein
MGQKVVSNTQHQQIRKTGRQQDRGFVCLCFIKIEGLRRSGGMAAPICKKGKGSENNNNRPCIKKLHGENAL